MSERFDESRYDAIDCGSIFVTIRDPYELAEHVERGLLDGKFDFDLIGSNASNEREGIDNLSASISKFHDQSSGIIECSFSIPINTHSDVNGLIRNIDTFRLGLVERFYSESEVRMSEDEYSSHCVVAHNGVHVMVECLHTGSESIAVNVRSSLDTFTSTRDHYETVFETIQVWAALQDIAATYPSVDPSEENKIYQITIDPLARQHRTTNGFDTWQLLTEYDAWSELSDTDGLPVIDYDTINFPYLAERFSDVDPDEAFRLLRELGSQRTSNGRSPRTISMNDVVTVFTQSERHPPEQLS